MSEREPYRLVGAGGSWPQPDPARFTIENASDIADALLRFEGAPVDAILLDGDATVPAPTEFTALLERAALVVVVHEPDAEHASSWLRRGACDVVGRAELDTPAGWRRLRFAIERRRAAEERQPTLSTAFSTDPGTGLPHRQQLMEHLSQLLALREREPSPMAVLAVRVEGLAAGNGKEGTAEAEVLRRKIAVRLRAGVRASDVVAALDGELFAVLLGSILGGADADRVADKLVAAVIEPLSVGGESRSVAAAIGIARYPQDGKDADRLLRRAIALAVVAPAAGQAGPATTHDAQGGVRQAANDEA